MTDDWQDQYGPLWGDWDSSSIWTAPKHHNTEGREYISTHSYRTIGALGVKWAKCRGECWDDARLSVSGVRQWEAGVHGDGAHAWRRAAGSDPETEILLGERGQRRASHHHQDRRVPALPGGEGHEKYYAVVWGPSHSMTIGFSQSDSANLTLSILSYSIHSSLYLVAPHVSVLIVVFTPSCLALGGAQRPEAQQHPLCRRVGESRVDPDLWLRLREATACQQRPADDPVLHR